MVESSPALALVLVQHKSMANDGSALEENKCGERRVEISKSGFYQQGYHRRQKLKRK